MQDADYRRLVEDSPLSTVIVRDGRVLWANTAAHELLAVPAGGLPGRTVGELVDPEDRAQVALVLSERSGPDPSPDAPVDRTAREWRLRRADGPSTAVEVVVTRVEFAGAPALSLACWDVSGHVARQRDLAHRATHDRLTGLPNRSLLEDRWTLARSRARRTGLVPLVAFCDVDDLKVVNDRHGHVVGDAVLSEVAERLRRASRGEDTVARFGGDEFIVLVESSADVEPGPLAARLREATESVPVVFGGGEVLTVRCSVGLVVDDLALSTADVLARADAVMYEEKRARR